MLKIFYILIAFISFSVMRAQSNVFEIARSGTVVEMEKLYNSDKNIVNATDANGSSPLILATYRGNRNVALFLAEHRANLNYNSPRGTALMAAVMNGDGIVLEKLLKLGANPNLKDKDGKTALILAVFFNKPEVVKILLSHGADKDIRDNDGLSALDYAKRAQDTQMIIKLSN